MESGDLTIVDRSCERLPAANNVCLRSAYIERLKAGGHSFAATKQIAGR